MYNNAVSDFYKIAY